MPHETIIRSEFAAAVSAALGDLTPNQASYKTAVSDEWIRKMTHGRVPSRAILERFALGLGADLPALLVAAGYEKPSGLVSAIEQALPAVSDIPEEAKPGLLRMIKGYRSARNASTQHYMIEAAMAVREKEEEADGDTE